MSEHGSDMCVNCGEKEASVGRLCKECDRNMMDGGYRGDGR